MRLGGLDGGIYVCTLIFQQLQENDKIYIVKK
jgi:hypothetical protein